MTTAITNATIEGKTVKVEKCVSDDQDSDTIKFEDVMNDSDAMKVTGGPDSAPKEYQLKGKV